MNLTAGMIILDSDYVLKQCLEQIYPFCHQILIAEGPVKYWQNQGKTTSTDKTNYILDNFPDPQQKIKIVHSQYNEKDDQCKAYMKHIKEDTEYLWNVDADEVYKSEDIEKLIKFLEKEKPSSVGVKSRTFYGGFDRYLTGFEENTDNFLRVFRYFPGSNWITHRPPTMPCPLSMVKHINSDQLYNEIGLLMYHYSYVYPRQVWSKINYYYSIGGTGNRIPDYFWQVYWPWLIGSTQERQTIEDKFCGVHEYLPNGRGPCFTAKFLDKHPESIEKSLTSLRQELSKQVQYVKEKLKK